MIAKQIIIDKVVEYVTNQIQVLSTKSPIMMLARPFVTRSVNNYIGKLDNFLSAIQDEKGMIDIEGIIDEEIDNLTVMQLQKVKGLEIGEGQIKFNIPMIDKSMVITTDDLADFKQSLLSNNK